MDIEELEARVSQIINETGIVLAQGTGFATKPDFAAREQQFDALEQELRFAVRASETPHHVQDILDMLLSFRGSLIGAGPDRIASCDYH